MKIRLEVKTGQYDTIKQELESYGIEIDDNADYVLSQRNTYAEYLFVRKEDVNLHVAVDDITYIETMGHDVLVYTQEDSYKCSERLWQLEKTLNPEFFLRISNSAIIAMKQVKKIKPALSQKFTLLLFCGKTIDVTRTYYYAFKEKFGI